MQVICPLGMTTDGTPTDTPPAEEVSIQVTHSVQVENSVPLAPFHEMAAPISSDSIQTLLGTNSHVTWQPSPAAVPTAQGILVTPP